MLPKDCIDLLGSLDDVSNLLELGNKKNSGGVFRDWYLRNGVDKYTSLDWNGLDGALKLDMQKEIPPEKIGGPFDMVTNFGFTEHVSEQLPCWTNVHNFLREGGTLICMTPVGDHWESHGFWLPDVEWYEEFAELNNYKVEHAYKAAWHGKKDGSKKEVRFRAVKQSSDPFKMPTREIYRTSLKK